jgi:hypothetical protein
MQSVVAITALHITTVPSCQALFTPGEIPFAGYLTMERQRIFITLSRMLDCLMRSLYWVKNGIASDSLGAVFSLSNAGANHWA